MSGVDKTIEHGLSVLREPLVALEAAKVEIERLRTELVSSEEKRKGLHKQSVDLQAEVSRLQRSFEARLREGEGLVSLQRAFNEQTNKVRAVLGACPGGSAGAYETMLEAAERVVRERDEALKKTSPVMPPSSASVLHSWFDALQKKEQTLWVLGVRLSTAIPSLFLAIGPDKRKVVFPLGPGSKLHPHTRIYGSKVAAMMAAKALSATCAYHLEPVELAASTRPDSVE